VGKILLFDIDQTLLYTGGAGSHAMTMAFHELWGIENAFHGFAFAGRTDPAILREAFVKHRVPVDTPELFAAAVSRFHDAYHGHLEHSLRDMGTGSVLPGVVALLDALLPLEGVHLGVATGNFRSGARLKLSHYGLHGYFLDGGYGDDAEDRGEMVAAAARRLAEHPSVRAGVHEVFVIGDTPHDIHAAKVNRHVAVGVGTGQHTRDDLLDAGADQAFDDLSDLALVLKALGIDAR
jgi:phosphoglycolate phosphatase-like HAD superfamily hydrolase